MSATLAGLSGDDLAELTPKERGDRLETEAVDAVEGLFPIPDEICEWHDAITTRPLTFGSNPMLSVFGMVHVPAYTPVEIKFCLLWQSNGVHRTRGRWVVKRGAHRQLADHRGVYLLGVYDDDAENPLLAWGATAARSLSDRLTWSNGHTERREEHMAKLGWTAVFDPDRLGGGDGEQ